MESEICGSASALELAATGLSFLTAVILLDTVWVRLPEKIGSGESPHAERRQRALNLFVSLGATAAAVMLLIWASACHA
jgi:hypothetical protein